MRNQHLHRTEFTSDAWAWWLAIGVLLGGLMVYLLVVNDLPVCQADEAWIAVVHNTAGGYQDDAGVTRMCVHLEDLIDGH